MTSKSAYLGYISSKIKKNDMQLTSAIRDRVIKELGLTPLKAPVDDVEKLAMKFYYATVAAKAIGVKEAYLIEDAMSVSKSKKITKEMNEILEKYGLPVTPVPSSKAAEKTISKYDGKTERLESLFEKVREDAKKKNERLNKTKRTVSRGTKKQKNEKPSPVCILKKYKSKSNMDTKNCVDGKSTDEEIEKAILKVLGSLKDGSTIDTLALSKAVFGTQGTQKMVNKHVYSLEKKKKVIKVTKEGVARPSWKLA